VGAAGVLLAIVVFLISSRARGAITGAPAEPRGESLSTEGTRIRRRHYSDLNVSLLASTLWAETSGRQKHGDEELTGIAFVAINRAQGEYSLADVLRPPGRSRYGVWNGSGAFSTRWHSANSRRGYERCVEIAEAALSGAAQNPIGNRALFFHPTGLPRPEGGECGARRVKLQTKAGVRCAPLWSTQNPLPIGEAIFCGRA